MRAAEGNTVIDAERDVLQRIGLFSDNMATDAGSSSSDDDDETQGKKSSRHRVWTRAAAIWVTRGVIAFARFPVDTATMRTQLSGTEHPIWIRTSWREFAVGFMYQWSSGKQMELLAKIVSAVVPHSNASSLTVDVLRIAVHYGAFAVLYGAMRQSVVARLGAASLRNFSAGAWMRDLVWSRRGAVFGVYVRDVAGNYVQESLHAPLFSAFVSSGVFSLYMAMLKGVMAARRTTADVVAALARITGTYKPHADEVEIEFVLPGGATQHNRSADRQGRAQQQRRRHADAELLVYMRYVSSVVSGIATRALLYPVDTLVVRLMADEAALTAHAYTGFLDCLVRGSSSLASLYAGFTRALVADVALGWVAAELAHVLCKTAWLSS
ncbi:hypothetical protein LPJ59_001747 [Coemansia sp. RSA 2399]|nr:hypothetical protein LPJ59_001747 [Coemansia sp. RSA 2399]KAJ1906200.1 hypothetical protein LPJ81_001481 [Coemansia sp. IMI 209127]